MRTRAVLMAQSVWTKTASLSSRTMLLWLVIASFIFGGLALVLTSGIVTRGDSGQNVIGVGAAPLDLPAGQGGGANLTQAQAGGEIAVLIDDVRADSTTGDSVPRLTILDTASGTVIGQLLTGYRPWVLLRPSKGQILVSQVFGPLPDAEVASLHVYDLKNLESPSMIIPIPGRIGETLHHPMMAISADEAYLYYAKATNGCPDGGGDASQCAVFSLGIVDLEAGTVLSAPELPAGCAINALVPIAQSNVLMACVQHSVSIEDVPGGVLLQQVGPSGEFLDAGSFPARRDGNWSHGVVWADSSAGGANYIVYADGVVLTSGGESTLAELLPGSALRIAPGAVALLGSSGLVIAPYTDDFGSKRTGYILFDRGDPNSSQNFALSSPALDISPVGSSSVALLGGDGASLQLVDVKTGELRQGPVIPDGIEWLD